MKWVLLRSAEDRRPAAVTGLAARPAAVLELLLLQANRSVSTDEIIDQLWPDDPPRTARNSVQRFVADIRSALGDDRAVLETTPNGYRLTVDPDDSDIGRVRRLRAEAEERRATDPAGAAELLAGAIALFGDLDAVPAPTAAAAAARAAHRELQLELTSERVDARLAAGAGDELVGELRDLTERHPYRERFWSQLMLALRAGGRRVEALRAFERLRQRLADEVGLDPSAELRQLERMILAESTEDAAPDAGSDATAGGERPLPGPALGATAATIGSAVGRDELIGREDDIDRVVERLGAHRVVTVTGLGGVGKTRLVAEIATRWATGEPGGSNGSTGPTNRPGHAPVVARLGEVAEGDHVAAVVAAALELQPESPDPDGTIDEIVDHLRRRPRLVVLDNAEHVLETVRRLVERAVDRSDARLLISSRQRIGLSGEGVVALGPLALPADGDVGRSDAERLFRRRAAAVDGALDGNEDAVAAICRALDGLPLAIELAAAQLAHVGPAELLDRLDARRLDLVGSPGQDHRHTTLGSMLAWSWDRLSQEEIALIEQLAVFSAPIDIATIERVAGARAFPVLTSLVARSLVTSTVIDGRTRFGLLETVRLYALARAEAGERLAGWRDAHAAHLLDVLRQWTLPDLNAWLDTIAEVERHQLEYGPALEWLDQQGRVDDVVELAARVTGLLARRGPGSQLTTWAGRLLELRAQHDLVHEDEVAVVVAAAEDGFRRSAHERVAELCEELIALEEAKPTDLGTPFVAFWGTAMHAITLDRRSRELVESAVQRAPSTDSPALNVAQTEMWLGSCQLMDRQFDEALASFSSVLDATSRPGGVLLWSELGRVTALLLLGRIDEAVAAMGDVTSTVEDSIWHYAVDIVGAVVAAKAGDPERARHDLVAAARSRIREQRAATRDDFQIGFGLLAAEAGDVALAAELLAEPLHQSPPTASLLVNHLHPEPMDAERWEAVWLTESLTRMDSLGRRLQGDAATVDEELARWAPGSDDRARGRCS
ncbi:MAG: BTAD domain-containing putative transcriptional regulator [Actinomycetota bacterium]